MENENLEPDPGITRRDALKRGAIFGGALVWATPVVQMVGMRPAFAQVPSANCDSTTCTNVRQNGQIVGSLICEPVSAEDEACFCCCAGLAEFCPDCNRIDPCNAEILCGDFSTDTCGERGF